MSKLDIGVGDEFPVGESDTPSPGGRHSWKQNIASTAARCMRIAIITDTAIMATTAVTASAGCRHCW